MFNTTKLTNPPLNPFWVTWIQFRLWKYASRFNITNPILATFSNWTVFKRYYVWHLCRNFLILPTELNAQNLAVFRERRNHDHHVIFYIRYFFFLLNGSTALVGPGRFFSFLIYSQSVRLLGRVISSTKGLYLNTRQHKDRKTHIHTKHTWPTWNSNPPSQRPNERSQFMP
jgi:hypothetical protein